MRSRSERQRRQAGCIAAALALTAVLSCAVAALPEQPHRAPPSEAQVATALRRLRADPNLVSTSKLHVLHWVSNSKPTPPDTGLPGWMQWLASLFGWLAESGRLIIWAGCVAVVGVLGIYLIRILREHGDVSAGAIVVAPTHVRDLDIRPASLPDDIGAASRDLWNRGEHRACLALLYRGCLSRLAHLHALPIRDSTTEGECVRLAREHLGSASTTYVSQLVRVWQVAVYRGEEPSAEVIGSLCEGFGAALDPAPATPAAAEIAA